MQTVNQFAFAVGLERLKFDLGALAQSGIDIIQGFLAVNFRLATSRSLDSGR